MEIETKLVYKNKLDVITILKSLGLKKTKTKEIQDTYFGFNGSTMSNKGSLYRLRDVVGVMAEVTLKDGIQDKNGVWSRRELNVKIDNPHNLVEIFKSIGAVVIKENFSTREFWEREGISVEFIDFSKPAKLSIIEVEGQSNEIVNAMIKALRDTVNVVGEEVFSVFDKT